MPTCESPGCTVAANCKCFDYRGRSPGQPPRVTKHCDFHGQELAGQNGFHVRGIVDRAGGRGGAREIDIRGALRRLGKIT